MNRMRAMTVAESGSALVTAELPVPEPGEHDIRLQVLACGVCRTDLHIMDGALVPQALRATRKGAVVVCAGIHMSEVPAFDYALLWGERSLRSVANLTREDGEAFFALIDRQPVTTHVQPFVLAQANEALAALRSGALSGAAVLLP